MKNKLTALILSAAVALTFAVPALASQITAVTEGSLEHGGISASVKITNKYVGEAEVKITPASSEEILDEFKQLAEYKSAEAMTALAGFEVYSETDFSGTITTVNVEMNGDFDKYFMEKIMVVHKYSENFEAIPVSIINPAGDNGCSLSFNTNYGLGQFVIIANPDFTGGSEDEPASSEISSPEPEASAPPDTPPSQESSNGTVVIIIIAVFAAAAVIGTAVNRKKRKKR